jgi:tetratricopeptide (TPR) repeat protein
LALSREQRFDDLREQTRILNGLGSALVQVGDYDQAIRYLLEAESLAGRVRAVDLQSQALSLLQQCWFRLDRWDEMDKIDEKRDRLREQYPLERLESPCFAIALSAAACTLRGDLERAETLRQESCAIMAGIAGPPERWARNQHY